MRREAAFRGVLFVSALAVVMILAGAFLTLVLDSLSSIARYGISFVTGGVWDPVTNVFGALPFLVGTLLTSFLALLISLPFSLALSIFLGEYFKKGSVFSVASTLMELLAGIPSVIYGFWGLLVLVPLVRTVEIKVGAAPYGVGILTASVILSIMIIPYAASIGREVLALVPQGLREAAFSLGATRFEVIRTVVLPYARSGIFAGIVLALGRALGETMAVTMVIGNSSALPKGLFDPGNTMASVIANEFTEATGELYLSSLIEIALLLFVVTTVVNLIARYGINKMTVEVQ